MEKRVLLTELVDRGSHLRKEITPTAVVTDDGKYTAGTFWDANKTLNEIVHGATEAQDTLKEVEDKLNNEIATARNAEQALSDRMDDILGIDALDIADLKGIVEDLDPETGILSVIDNKVDKEDFEDLKEDISIELSTVVEDANGHDYVEIAGIKWATMNVGAQNVTDTGLYFQWGDTQGYTASEVGTGSGQKTFNWEDYKYTNDGGSTMSKYNTTDGKTVLDASDDAATAAWGGSWRMPTTDEFQALSAATTSAYTADYEGSGVAGLVLTSNADSSKKLFFPACGYAGNGSVDVVGNLGYYCSSSLISDNVNLAFVSYFNPVNVYWDGSNYRCSGCSVRGILGSSIVQQKVLGTTITDAERTKWNTVDNKANTADLGTAAAKNVPTTGNASTTEVVMGNDSRLTDARTPVAHTHTKSEITDFPTNVSSFTNDAGYLTQHQSLTNYVEKSNTAGLLKNDGTVDTNTYLTSHQDISGKANVSDISVTTTTTVNADDNGHAYVDLGLPSGTLWATMNVGASSETGYGDYYMYGKTTTYNSSDSIYEGTEDPLSSSVDVASVNWGGDWNLPTKAQFDELIANTTSEWATIDGVNGRKFTATNGNYVFFPAGGSYNDGSQVIVGSNGIYWSSTPNGSDFAYYLYFYSGGKSVSLDFRKNGYSVRPVLPGPTTSTSTVLGKTATDAEKAAWNAKSNFSGSYDDLTNKPTIPAALIQSDWNQSTNTALDYIKNKPNVVTSTTTGLKIEVVASMPVSPDANTIYIVQ